MISVAGPSGHASHAISKFSGCFFSLACKDVGSAHGCVAHRKVASIRFGSFKSHRWMLSGACLTSCQAQVSSTECIRVRSLVHARMPKIRDAQALDNRNRLLRINLTAKKIYELSNEQILILACLNDPDAACERFRREIMRVDNLHKWEDADARLREIDRINDMYVWILTMPHKIGIASAVVASFWVWPHVFHRQTAESFNERYVTADAIPDEDLETTWEVGQWTWKWMEPPIGTVLFVLLTAGFVRAQILNLGKIYSSRFYKPYTSWVQSWRADVLVRKFPQYEEGIVRKFVQTDALTRNLWKA